MPRGKFVNHKGRNRHFTSPEDLEEERKAEESKRWRKKKDDNDSGEEEEESGSEKSGSEESGSESESDEDDRKKGGAHGLIEIENPNRIQKKQVVKVSTLKVDDEDQGASSNAATSAPKEPVELSRREREEIERQKKQAHYQKLHAQGKTDQAKADLARLAIIKQQREEAAKQRELKNAKSKK